MRARLYLSNEQLVTCFIDPGCVGVYGKLRNHSKIAPGGLRNSYCDFFPKNLVFDKLAFSLNMAVFLHPNGPKCLRNE